MADAKPLAPFTRGPLHITREVDSEGYCQHIVRASNHIALAVLGNYSPHEQLANAALYAAAPELLSLLQDAVEAFGPHLEGGDDEWLQFARAAIAKATTRPAQGEAQ